MGILARLKGWKTFGFSAIVGMLGVAETLDWTHVTSDQTAGIILATVALINMVLRAVTTTPISKKFPEDKFHIPGLNRILNR